MTKLKRMCGCEQFKVRRRGDRVRPKNRALGHVDRKTISSSELLEREERITRSLCRTDDCEVINDCKTLTGRDERGREERLNRNSKGNRGQAIPLADSISRGDDVKEITGGTKDKKIRRLLVSPVEKTKDRSKARLREEGGRDNRSIASLKSSLKISGDHDRIRGEFKRGTRTMDTTINASPVKTELN